MPIHSQGVSAEELLQSLECINCDTIPASLYVGKELVHTANDMLFLDWMNRTILSEDTDWSGRFITCFLCECAGCSTPWNQSTKLALPASWYDPEYWRLHDCGASSDETQSHICVRYAKSRNTFFPFHILDQKVYESLWNMLQSILKKRTLCRIDFGSSIPITQTIHPCALKGQ